MGCILDPVDRLDWIKLVPKASNGDMPAMAVAMQLAPMINSKLGYAYPSIAYMVNASGLSRKTIIRGIKSLESFGLISIERYVRKVNKYRLISKEHPVVLVPNQTLPSPSLGTTLVPNQTLPLVPDETPQSRMSNQGINQGSNQRGRKSAKETLPMPIDNVILNLDKITGEESWDDVKQTSWVKILRINGCPITESNWLEWYGLICRSFKGDTQACANAAQGLLAKERWPENIESLVNPPKEKITPEIVSNRLRELMVEICDEVYVKNESILKAAHIYGPSQLINLAHHVKPFGDGLTKDAFRDWFMGRPSPYGGWDYYEPKNQLEHHMTLEAIIEELK